MAASGKQVLLVAISLVTCSATVLDYNSYTMSDYCGRSIIANPFSEHSVKVQLTQGRWYDNDMDCKVTVKAAFGMRLIIKFLEVDIDEGDGTCDDYLEIHDGKYSPNKKLIKLCGGTKPRDITTSDRFAYLRFHSNDYGRDEGFKLLITQFHTGPCLYNDFSCDNGRCINRGLYCDDDDNCGDNSDHCYMDNNWWVWMVAGMCAFVLVVSVSVAIVCCCCCRKGRQGTVIKNNTTTTSMAYQGAQQTVAPVGNPWYVPPAQPNTQLPPPAYTPASGSGVYPPPQSAEYPQLQPPAYQQVQASPYQGGVMSMDNQAFVPEPPPYSDKPN